MYKVLIWISVIIFTLINIVYAADNLNIANLTGVATCSSNPATTFGGNGCGSIADDNDTKNTFTLATATSGFAVMFSSPKFVGNITINYSRAGTVNFSILNSSASRWQQIVILPSTGSQGGVGNVYFYNNTFESILGVNISCISCDAGVAEIRIFNATNSSSASPSADLKTFTITATDQFNDLPLSNITINVTNSTNGFRFSTVNGTILIDNRTISGFNKIYNFLFVVNDTTGGYIMQSLQKHIHFIP